MANNVYDESRAKERLLICAGMKNPGMVDEVAAFLKPEHFYVQEYATAWSVISGSESAKGISDPAIVGSIVKAVHNLTTDATETWLYEIESAHYHGEFIVEYAKWVLDYHKRREMLSISEALRAAASNDGIQAADSLAITERRLERIAVDASLSSIISVGDALPDILDTMASAGEPRPKTGIPALDELTGGLRTRQLVVIGARPSHGKSALGLTIAQNVAEAGTGVLFCSPEMTKEELIKRMLARTGDHDVSTLDREPVPERLMKRVAESANMLLRTPLYIDDVSRKLSEIISSIRLAKKKHNIKVVMIDYLQMVQADDPRQPREQQISGISRALKAVAKEQNISVVAMAQLRRDIESRADKTPMLSDLRESGAIEQDADTVWFIHRPSKYDDQVPDDVAQLIVAKQRQGKTGVVGLRWHGPTTTFRGSDALPDPVDF